MSYEVAKAYVQIVPTTKNFKSQLKIAIGSDIEELGSDEGTKFGSNMNDSAVKMIAAGAIITEIAKVAAEAIQKVIEIGSEYETALAKVETIMDDTEVSSDDMSAAILELSSDMGVAASDISDTVYSAISATGDTANAVSLTAAASKLATAGFTDTDSALSALTTAMNAYGLSADDATAISDSLIQTQNLGVTTVDELASSMGKAISTASAYGIDLSNLEAGYVSLTKAGISTEESTTYLSSMFNELGDSGSTVAGIIKDETGMSFGELMESGYSLGDVLGILEEYCDGDSEALMNLWSSAEAGKASNAIVSQGLEDFNENLDSISNSAGTTETAYETMSDTMSYQLSVLQTTFENLAIELFDELEPALSAIIDAAQTYLVPLLEWGIDNLPAVASALGGVVAVLTTIQTIKKGASVIKAISSSLKFLAGNPVVLVVAAVAALVTAFIYLWNNCDAFREFFLNLWEKIKNAVAVAKEVISTALSAIQGFFSNAWEKIQTIVQTVLEMINTIITSYMDTIRTVIETVWNAIVTVVTTVWNAIRTVITTVITVIKTIITTYWNAVYTVFSTIWNAIKTVVTTVINKIQTVITTVMTKIKTTISTIVTKIESVFVNPFNTIKTKVTNILTTLKTWISSWGTTLKNKFSSIGENLISGLWNGIKDKVDWVIEKIKGLGDSIIKSIKSVFGIKSPSRVFAEIGEYMALGMGSGFTDEMDGVSDSMADSAQGVLDSISDLSADASAVLSGTISADATQTLQSNIDWTGAATESSADASAERLETLIILLNDYLPEILSSSNKTIVLDSGTLVGEIAPEMDKELGRLSRKAARL